MARIFRRKPRFVVTVIDVSISGHLCTQPSHGAEDCIRYFGVHACTPSSYSPPLHKKGPIYRTRYTILPSRQHDMSAIGSDALQAHPRPISRLLSEPAYGSLAIGYWFFLKTTRSLRLGVRIWSKLSLNMIYHQSAG